MKEKKRSVEVVVVSDVHLGTYGCHAKELLKYLKSIKPGKLILNGDIIDIWQFRKRYWPKSHMKVIKYIIGLAAKNVETFYVTGNHDETLRKFSGLEIGSLKIVDKVELKLDDKKAWVFHGDVFDVIMKYSKWLAKLGAIGYDSLIYLNVVVNKVSAFFGKGKVSLSKKVKDNVKSALKYIDDFENSAAQMALSKGYDYVVCGHIHKPGIREIKDDNGKKITYLNSGDWIENLSALEYNKGKWSVYSFLADKHVSSNGFDVDETGNNEADMDNKELFNKILLEFQN